MTLSELSEFVMNGHSEVGAFSITDRSQQVIRTGLGFVFVASQKTPDE